eukprot:TRINITY_DN1402_c0_g1_i1.p1 TRINITY_DN1402_c0_g1~~TRINITY_DN1402_c0_g1_i1.p1  ORF type:complete len:474 (-),score=76.53 TRINITY_DN1402_c0_g1_i1:21-1442(-)
MSYIPSNIRKALTDLDKRINNFEENKVSKWNSDDKVQYYHNKINTLVQFLQSYDGQSPIETNSGNTSVPVENKTNERTSINDSNDTVKKIMNNVYKQAQSEFNEGSYSGSDILDVIKQLIVQTTLSTGENSDEETLANVKTIMNDVFKTLRGHFSSNENYPVNEILQGVKDTIVSITVSLLSNSGQDTTTSNQTKNTNVKVPSQPKVPKEPRRKQSDGIIPVSESPKNSSKSSISNIRSTSDSPGMITARNDAIGRIRSNPGSQEVDITEAEVLEAYLKCRDDDDDTNWILLGYKGTKNKLFVEGLGNGGIEELMEEIDDSLPFYIYFSHNMGDTNRPRFVFMTYIPEHLNGLQKSRVLRHRADVETFIKFSTITWHFQELSEFSVEELESKLLAASGANYSVQESNKGNFTAYKTKTADFYSETEKRGSKMKIIYDSGPLTTTPCDISGRATVASASEFLSNTSNSMRQRNY